MHQPKDIDWLGRWKNVHVCTSLTHHSAWPPPPGCRCLFYIDRLIMFLFWPTTAITFYFLPGYWLWKLISIFYYCDYVTITHIIPLYHDWSIEKQNSVSLKLPFNRKSCNHFLKPRCISELPWNFWKTQMLRCCFFSPELQICF